MSRSNNNLPEQHLVNAAHSSLQPINLDTFAVTNDPTTPSLGKSEAIASIQHQNDSERLKSQQTSYLSPKALTWSKGNGVNSPRIYREFVFPIPIHKSRLNKISFFIFNESDKKTQWNDWIFRRITRRTREGFPHHELP